MSKLDKINEYGVIYHPDNIPTEIKDSVDTSYWGNIYCDGASDKTGDNETYYIYNIVPSNYRKHTILRFNALMRKYDWPTNVSSSGYGDKLSYTGVNLEWKHFYRYMNEETGKIHKDNRNLIQSVAFGNRLDSPSSLTLTEHSSAQLDMGTYNHVPHDVYEVYVSGVYVESAHYQIDSVGRETGRSVSFTYKNAERNILTKQFNYSSCHDEAQRNSVIAGYENTVCDLEDVECYDSFVLERKLDLLDI